jgi:hypothetical protein
LSSKKSESSNPVWGIKNQALYKPEKRCPPLADKLGTLDWSLIKKSLEKVAVFAK